MAVNTGVEKNFEVGKINYMCVVKFYPISICDWIWENPASTHKYKYLEIPNLIIWSIITQEGKQMLAWNLPRFCSYL